MKANKKKGLLIALLASSIYKSHAIKLSNNSKQQIIH